MTGNQAKRVVKKWGIGETLFVAWIGAAMAVLIPAMRYLRGSFPLFTFVWLVVPLLAVILTRDANRVGFRGISWWEFLSTTAINLAGLFLVSVLVEPWSHAYQTLVREAISNSPPDTTFAWLVRFDGSASPCRVSCAI
jgi:hypothetical protein